MKYTLKEQRKIKNLTQEDLAKSSGISIRTIQRIEKGLSSGSAYTIKTLANALDVESSEILTDGNLELTNSVEDRSKLKIMNLSILTVLIIPFGNIIFPFIIFIRNRNNLFFKIQGKKILSFQILTTLSLPFLIILMTFITGKGPGQFPLNIFIPYLLYIAITVLITVKTAIDINVNKEILAFSPNLL